jgi:DNA ligase-1
MERFSELFQALDGTTATNRKVACMRAYFRDVPAEDGAWAVYLLSGRLLKRLIGPARLREWLAELTGLPDWLVHETREHVGDLAETISLMVDDGRPGEPDARALHRWIAERVLVLRELDEDAQRRHVQAAWRALPPDQCFLFNKLLTGGLRVGVSQTLVERALAEAAGLPRTVIAGRLTGNWAPDAAFFRGLFAPASSDEDASRPYPFFLAHALESEPEALGPLENWLAEWKWDGIRAQILVRAEAVFIWSRGEDMVGHQFPELAEAARSLPAGTVLDGEIVAWRDGQVQPFATLQRRLGRKRVGAKLLREAPVAFLAFDQIEHAGRDCRDQPQWQRRETLTATLADADARLMPSPLVEAQDWSGLAEERASARQRRVEGIMLKHREAAYGVGRRKGSWWKWKIEPLTLDAVLIYAQPGHGRRANLYTDYTFAVWQQGQLIPVTKAYSGLDDGEIRRLDQWIRRHTRERFGPVRSVEPAQVFELAFEGIQPSSRHKSGVALRFPRIARWREDLGINDADTLDQVRELLDDDETG